MNARETAARLGVKLDTLYAYVSRGMIHSVAVPGSRERHYREADVERLRAGRGIGHGREALIPVIDSAICLIADGRFYYRGIDALSLADSATLEAAAAVLWGGDIGQVSWASAPHPFPLPARGERVSGAKRRTGEGDTGRRADRPGLIERVQIRLATLAAADMAALDLTRDGVARTGAAILYELAAAVSGTADAGEPVHAHLAASWGLDAAGSDLVRRVLVLLADHELNASTFVARCVASTGATPYAAVSAALSALSGRRHGGAAARAEALFHQIGHDADPMAVMAARLARDEALPGLGQPLYPDGDPRARAIIAAIAATRPAEGARIAAAAAAAMRLTGQHPNVDFALAAAASALGLPPGAALSLFVVARSVGWIAHAIEQYDSDVLIRPRARYTGPRPGGDGEPG
ncbi:MAG TPA: citrate/2-methylcitrate synthase [Stellaceae bacterium]|nr:citrate/2-methylcitrate synthase [Stellaceae bacterium]